jgi:hypothetical protein
LDDRGPRIDRGLRHRPPELDRLAAVAQAPADRDEELQTHVV